MFTVIELLSRPIFANFRLVSGASGLYNVVTGTGIFEWESYADVDKTFLEGDFVITTLSQAKDNPNVAENYLKMLIERKVSAIAIKSIYYDEISESIKTFAEFNNTPIFFFADTYFDDIIFTIKNLLISNTLHTDNAEKVKILLKTNTDSDTIVKLAKELNPFFYNHVICCFASSNDVLVEKGERPENDYLDNINFKSNHTMDSSNTIYSFIRYGYGILIIFTVKNLPVDLHAYFMNFLDQMGIKSNMECLGLSNVHSSLENLGISMGESIYSNISCLIDQEPVLNFSSTGLDQLLMPICNDKWAKRYYDNLLNKISGYDEIHNLNLMDTLFEYIKCNGNIQLTSQRIFQHSNTIRYRLDKIKKLLNIEESADSYSQIYVIARLNQIYQYLDLFD